MTREQWLQAAVTRLRADFDAIERALPATVHVSVGWPSKAALARTKQRIGECWAATCSADGCSQVYISPVLADPVRVLDVLVHELTHAAVGCQHGHRGPFIKAARAIGLEGKPTATTAGSELEAKLRRYAGELGDYPHAQLTPAPKATKSGGSRMRKAACPNGCGTGDKVYTVRVTRIHLDSLGPPECPGCKTLLAVDGDRPTEDHDDAE